MLEVRLLGGLEMAAGGKPLPLPTSRKAQALLVWLALHPGPHPRGALAARFWPEVLDTSARQSLRSAVWALRRALGPAATDALVVGRDHLELRAQVDIHALRVALEEGRREDALAIGRVELCPELDAEWIHAERDAHRERLITALGDEVAAAEAAGDGARALALARERAALDPLADRLQHDVIRLLIATGQRTEAVAAYARHRDRMRRDLRMSPAAETRALVDALREPGEAPTVGEWVPSGAPPLVGRDHELDNLERALADAIEGRGAVVLLAGEGGIGKTRLATELLDRAAAGGARTAAATAVDLGGAAAPFGVWAELSRELARGLPAAPSGARWPMELSRLVPSSITLAADPSSAPAPDTGSPELERVRLSESVVSLVEHACRDQPLAMLIEDVHLSDTPSLELTAYVARRLGRLPVLLLLTRRETPPHPQLERLLDHLRGRGVLRAELALAPLGQADVARLVDSVAQLEAEVARALVAASEGSPLLAVEGARAAAAGADAPARGLRALAREALARVAPEAAELMRLVAVAGRPLERAEVAALASHDAVAEAVVSGLLRAPGGRPRFRHALLRDALAEDIRDPERIRLHQRLAEVLGELGSAPAAERARHLRLAGLDDEAVGALAEAAAEARAVGALEEAAAAVVEALELAPSAAELWLELAAIEAWRGRREALEEAFARALELIDPADSARRARAWNLHGRWHSTSVCVPLVSIASYRRALAELEGMPSPPRELHLEVLAGLAVRAADTGEAEASGRLIAKAEALGADAASDEIRAELELARGSARIAAGDFGGACAPLSRAGLAFSAAGRPDRAYLGWLNAACAAACAGDFEAALEHTQSGLSACQGIATLLVQVFAARAYVLSRLGRLAAAKAAADEQLTWADRIGNPALVAVAVHDQGMIAFEGGRVEEAAELLREAIAADAAVPRAHARIVLAESLARLGRADEAETELRAAAMEPLRPADLPATLVPRLTRVQGLIAAAHGDLDGAEARLQEAAATWRRLPAAGREQTYNANVVDLGRPPVAGLVEPARELERVERELAELRSVPV